jgi:hypothetical protein
MRYYQRAQLREDIRKVTDRDLLRNLGEKLRALPPDIDVGEQLLQEKEIEERSLSLLNKLEERWGYLITERQDAESFERCRHSRDEFDSFFQEFSKRQSEELVRQLEEKISHWKELHHRSKTGASSVPAESNINELELSLNEMANSLPMELRGQYQDKLAEMKQAAVTKGE